jgi:hypothetical protein
MRGRYLSGDNFMLAKPYTHLLVALFLESCWLCRLIVLKSPLDDVCCFCLPAEFVSTFGFMRISFNGLIERSLRIDESFPVLDDFAAGTLQLALDWQSLGVPSTTTCLKRFSLSATGESESDDELVLLISYRILFDITGRSEQTGLEFKDDALLALDNSTTYNYHRQKHTIN